MSDRFTTFDPELLSSNARAVHDRIFRERGYLPGPYRFWLASPGFANRIEPVEEFLRHGVALEERQVELVVLVVARHWKSQYVWSSHGPAALQAGVEASAIEAIRTGAAPAFERGEDATCYALCKAMLEQRAVDDALWAQALAALGERRINEIMGLLGLYTSVCLTMVGYRMPTKDGGPDPLA
jgi:4-carboxymuconolactone decarboxylase